MIRTTAFPAFRLAALFVGALATLVILVAFPASASAAQSTLAVPVSGELSDGGSFKGKIINPEVAKNDAGDLVLKGTLQGTATTADGATKKVSERFRESLTVTSGAATTGDVTAAAPPAGCKILQLDIGAIDLDLLGLVVNLSPISLDVTAVPGAGNLLGNLLCSLVGLLDGFDLSNVLKASFLNALLRALFG